MAVWSFACRNESSNNRWFDGTDQYFAINDIMVAEVEKSTGDVTSALDEQRKVLIKNISSVKSGIGSAMFNEIMLNQVSTRLSDFKDAVLMHDNIEVNLSREIVRINDIIYPVEYFNKTIELGRGDSVDADDDSFINYDDGDVNGVAIDNAPVTDISLVQMTRVIQPDIGDSVTFSETFNAGIGGKSLYDIVDIDDSVGKEVINSAGDETFLGAIGTFMFNELMFNGAGEEATVATVIGLTEEVQIILT